MSSNLAELLVQLQAGNEAALLSLHEQYAHLVYSVAYRILNDTMAAEEVTQDTFMGLWHKAESFNPARGSFVTWLLTVTRRLAIDAYRKQQRLPQQSPLPGDDGEESWAGWPGAEQDHDLRRTLIAVMGDLPEDQRQAIELAYFYGMSHSQIADYLTQPVGTIKTRIRLGMQKLREAWLSEPAGNPNREQ